MKQIYFIDSENVNDAWLFLLDYAKDEDEILVFYTPKSPHMSYRGLRKLKESNKEVTFIECYEGTNALDFQLVGELGCQLGSNIDCEFIIVSNDTGFDAVLRYWKDRNYPVKRYNAQYCKNLHRNFLTQKSSGEVKRIAGKKVDLLEQKEFEAALSADEAAACETPVEDIPVAEAPECETSVEETPAAETPVEEAPVAETPVEEAPVAEAPAEEAPVCEAPVEETPATKAPVVEVPATKTPVEETPAAETPVEEAPIKETPVAETPIEETPAKEPVVEENTVPDPPYNWDEILRIVGCIGKDNLGAIHTALQLFYGEESTDIYYAVKDKLPSLKKKTWAKKDKYRRYLKMVFAHSHYEGDIPDDFYAFIYNDGNKRSNLNSLRYALNSKYGKDKGMKLYSVVKPHMKTLNVI